MKARIEILRNAQMNMYKRPMNDKIIKCILRDLYKLLDLNPNDIVVHTTIGKIFVEKHQYQKAIIHFYKAHRYDENYPSAIYGIYKCSVMIGEFEKASIFLKKYKEKTNASIELAQKGLEVVLNKNANEKITDNKKLFTIDINDEELQETYNKLIEEFNNGNYEQAILLADECEIICRIKKIYLEFNTIAVILKKAKEIRYQLSRDEDYNNNLLLKEAILNDEHYKVIVLLNRFDKSSIKDSINFYNAIRYLINKEYITEAKKIIMSIPLYSERLETQLLLQECDLKKQVVSYDEQTKKIYKETMMNGKEFLIEEVYEDAYDTFLKGYYITQAPIFLYFIGKTLYKAGNYEQAEETLLEYVKNGGVNSAKAYIYLRNIARLSKKPKKEKRYGTMANNIFRTFYPEFSTTLFMEETEDRDKLKEYLQTRKAHSFDDIFKKEAEVRLIKKQ